jgi:hypothetical protein
VLYDEIRNEGLSKKIEDIRAFTSQENQHYYSKFQVEKLREDLY